MLRVLRSKGGFTYIGALVMVMIVGIMATRAAVVWSTAAKREREEELLSRGTQIRDALRKWYKVKVVDGKLVSSEAPAAGAQPAAPKPIPGPTDLDVLVKDPQARALRPYCLIDPITGKKWDLIKQEGRIVGVKSTSTQAPIKQGNFPFDLHPQDFEKKQKYSEWEFVYDHVPPTTATGGAVTGLGGSKSSVKLPSTGTSGTTTTP
ncbi:type II secretion system protein [Geomonas edaphica]|uniref:type II secretion system protein n=1 Tax=Geomonas edaphica TaxID=2570226 RepID=UPI0018E07D36|nr:type II secretion system protein [Geomonas edaphica]